MEFYCESRTLITFSRRIIKNASLLYQYLTENSGRLIFHDEFFVVLYSSNFIYLLLKQKSYLKVEKIS